MKKKVLLTAVTVITLLSVITVFLSASKKTVLNGIEETEVYRGSFQRQKKITAQIESGIHLYYFPGNIIEVYRNIGDEVKNKECILKYSDMYGNSKKLLSSTKGIITEISAGQVKVNDNCYYVSSYVDIETRNRLKLNSQHLFKTYNETLLTELDYVSSFGQKLNNQLLFEIRLNIIRGGNVLLKQQGTLMLNLEEMKDVLMVDKRALLKDEQGYYLLDCLWLEDADNISRYRIDVRVLESDDRTAVIDGIDIENQRVLVLSENIKELLK